MLDYGCNIDDVSANGNVFDNNNVGWLAALGWEGYLYNPILNDGHITGFKAYLPQPYSKAKSREAGGVDQYDFNISFNF